MHKILNKNESSVESKTYLSKYGVIDSSKRGFN